MELAIILIRNGITSSGKEGRYTGILDEPLLPEAKQYLLKQKEKGAYPEVELVFCSPVLRCRETVELLYPSNPAIIIQGLGALDIGSYTGRRYNEIIGDQEFYQWADDRQLGSLGHGEAPYAFMARCNAAFRRICEEAASKGVAAIAIVTHSSVIDTLLQRNTVPRNQYKYWPVSYGGAVLLSYDTVLRIAKIQKVF